ncbi:MAG: lipid-A-disaccharide synthase [Gammaproteobacteria bacterium]|nr:lipid-A-disaccharide synthase [Gammaproteobacteria bacterium]
MAAEGVSPCAMIVAGEASGDLYGARLARELENIMPDITCYGLGGEHMRKAGIHLLADVSELSVIGLVEVIKHYPRLRNILKTMKRELKRIHPDVLVLIDSPDFNLPLAKHAARCGIRVMYYVSPQIWAWRSSRIRVIRKCVDHMATVFPFEEKFYRDAGVPVEYVGHPLVEDAHSSMGRDAFLKAHRLSADKKLVGLFPGSRTSEVEHNLPTLVQAAGALARQRSDVQFIVPVASTLRADLVQRFIRDTEITTSTASIYDVIHACDAIAATSGTVTLQITLMQTPMLIIYKVSPLTFRILSRLVNFTYAGIANVIAGKLISREFIQHEATADNVAGELQRLLSDSDYTARMKKEMGDIRDALGEKNGSAEAARLAVRLMNSG